MTDRLLELVVDGVAVYRLTRLVTADSITASVRDFLIEGAYINAGKEKRAKTLADSQHVDLALPDGWSTLAQKDPDPPKFAELLTCRYCAGMWIAAAAGLARLGAPRAWRAAARVLALSAAAALIAGLEQG